MDSMDFTGFESVLNQILKKQHPQKMFSWKNMPREIFSEIIMKVGVESLEDANNCRQVCKNWNQMILDLTKHEVDIIRKGFKENSASDRLKSLWDASSEVKSGGLSGWWLKDQHFLNSILYKAFSNMETSLGLSVLKAASSLAYHGPFEFGVWDMKETRGENKPLAKMQPSPVLKT